MAKISRRTLCLAVAAFLMAVLLPFVLNGSAAAETNLGKTTKDNVNFRVGPSMKDSLLFRIPINTVLECEGTKTANGYDWYIVKSKDPTSKYATVYTGYVRSDCFRMLTDAEAEKYNGGGGGGGSSTDPTADNTDAPAGTIGYITHYGVNFRTAPGKKVIKQLDKGTEVNVLTIPSFIDNNHWYKVEYQGSVGYIMSTYMSLTGTDPVITPTPTPKPDTGDVLGYVQTIKGSVNVRASIGGTSITQVGKYETFPYLLPPVKRGSYTWYFVQVSSSVKGYIRGDCVKVVKGGGGETGLITPTPTPIPVITPTPTPEVLNPTGWVKTTDYAVNVRKGPGSSDIIGRIDKKGTILPFYGDPVISQKGIKWYQIYHKDYGFAYIHGGFVEETDEGGTVVTPTPTPTATPTPTPTATPSPTPTGGTPSTPTPPPSEGTKTEASYTTLRPGSSGNAVKNLVTELKNQGYFKYEVTSNYTSSVETAVRNFQAAKGLATDGIAGEKTQHALFNTVPIGTGDRTNYQITLYPAEKIDWNTGGIQELWTRGANVKVYDVKTGIVWWAHRWAGGLHVDAEPLTAEDTHRLCLIYGVSDSSQITNKTHWQRRPILITIGTRTFAASMYGVPHNYPDGDTIDNNDFKGQLCIHFTNSKTHESKKVDTLHQEAIEYAWKNAPNGHK